MVNVIYSVIIGVMIWFEEVVYFGKLVVEWWDFKGLLVMLYKFNLVCLGFVCEVIDFYWYWDLYEFRLFVGKCVFDVGCGVGLLCELLVWFGVDVIGVDVVLENVVVVCVYVVGLCFVIDYCCGDVGEFGFVGFDLVIFMEVIEYVVDK